MNPSTGAFISMDAYPGTIFDPVSLHKYLYAHANPVMNHDPTGYFTLMEMFISMNISNTLRDTYNSALLSGLMNMLYTYYKGGSPGDMLQSFFSGFASGMIIGPLGQLANMFKAGKFLMALGGLGSIGHGFYQSYQDFRNGDTEAGWLLLLTSSFGAVGWARQYGPDAKNLWNGLSNRGDPNAITSSTGSRFPNDPNKLFPEGYAGLKTDFKPDGKIIYEVQSGTHTYIVEYHPNHRGAGHYDGNHYHVKKVSDFPPPGKTSPKQFRLHNYDPNTPATPGGGTFAPGDLLPTRIK